MDPKAKERFSKIQLLKDNTPSYVNLLDDGAPFVCADCGESARRGMVSVFTTDGQQRTLHWDCVDPEWAASATCYGAM